MKSLYTYVQCRRRFRNASGSLHIYCTAVLFTNQFSLWYSRHISSVGFYNCSAYLARICFSVVVRTASPPISLMLKDAESSLCISYNFQKVMKLRTIENLLLGIHSKSILEALSKVIGIKLSWTVFKNLLISHSKYSVKGSGEFLKSGTGGKWRNKLSQFRLQRPYSYPHLPALQYFHYDIPWRLRSNTNL